MVPGQQKAKKKKTNPPPLTAKDIEYQKLKDESDFAKKCEHWCSAIGTVVNKQIFNSKQLLVHEDEDEWGSDWQKVVCARAEVDPARAKEFWERKGRSTARDALNNKRSNTTGAMKKVFLSKCCKLFCKELLLMHAGLVVVLTKPGVWGKRNTE
jgi:hypothetical protein